MLKSTQTFAPGRGEPRAKPHSTNSCDSSLFLDLIVSSGANKHPQKCPSREPHCLGHRDSTRFVEPPCVVGRFPCWHPNFGVHLPELCWGTHYVSGLLTPFPELPSVPDLVRSPAESQTELVTQVDHSVPAKLGQDGSY